MRRIEKLLIRAKNINFRERASWAFVARNIDTGGYTVSVQIWNGIPYSGTRSIEADCDTLEAASEFISLTLERYPATSGELCVCYDYIPVNGRWEYGG